jgi:phage terminase small subunit
MTDRQARFVEEYCVDFNATRAAIRAGYSERTAYSIGHENLRKPEIRGAVDARLAELSMSAAEATKRLTNWGRGSVEPFLAPGGLSIDLGSETAQANLHLLKKVKVTEKLLGTEGTVVATERKVEIELHDAKDAVVQIAKIRGLYTEKVEHSGPEGGPIPTEIVITRRVIDPANGDT